MAIMKKMGRATAKPMGDSGTFGTPREMNRMYQALNNPQVRSKLIQKQNNAKSRAMMTGTYNSPKSLGEMIQGSFKKGGMVKKTGIYKLHKGEKVLTKGESKKHEMKETKKHESKESKSKEMKENKKVSKKRR